MAAKKRKKKKARENKAERDIKSIRDRDFALNYGGFGYPYSAQAMKETL